MRQSTETHAGVMSELQVGCASSAAFIQLMNCHTYPITVIVLGSAGLALTRTSVGMFSTTKVQPTCLPTYCKIKSSLKQRQTRKTQNNEIVWSTSCMHMSAQIRCIMYRRDQAPPAWSPVTIQHNHLAAWQKSVCCLHQGGSCLN